MLCSAIVTSLLLIMPVQSLIYDQKVKAEYFSNVTLSCDYVKFNKPVFPFIRYWVLPNGTTIHQDIINHPKFILNWPQASLTITRIEDADFGDYYCIILWDNYNFFLNAVKVGLNIDGAYYGTLTARYQMGAIIGGSAALGLLLILSCICLIYKRYYYNERLSAEYDSDGELQEAVYDLDKAIQSYDNAAMTTDADDAGPDNGAVVNSETGRNGDHIIKSSHF